MLIARLIEPTILGIVTGIVLKLPHQAAGGHGVICHACCPKGLPDGSGRIEIGRNGIAEDDNAPGKVLAEPGMLGWLD